MAEEIHFDCLILGAGISGLDAAYHIQVFFWSDQKFLSSINPKYNDRFCLIFTKIYTNCFLKFKTQVLQVLNFRTVCANLCNPEKNICCIFGWLVTKYVDLTKNNLYYRNIANGPIMQFWRDVQTLEALGIFSNTLALGLTVTCIPLAFRGKFGSLQSPSHPQRTSSLIWKRLLRSKGL